MIYWENIGGKYDDLKYAFFFLKKFSRKMGCKVCNKITFNFFILHFNLFFYDLLRYIVSYQPDQPFV